MSALTLKTKVGLFDSTQFKRIKRMRENNNYNRDMLTSIWFEILDKAGSNFGKIEKNIKKLSKDLERPKKDIIFAISFYLSQFMIKEESEFYIVQNFGFDKDNKYIIFYEDSRTCKKYKDWRKFVLERDNYTCQWCGINSKSMHAHHILSWAKYPTERFAFDNGICLCEDCHKKIHREEK